MGNPIEFERVLSENTTASTTMTVADILESQLEPVIADWLSRVDILPELTAVSLNFGQRTGHLHQLLLDVIRRLRLDGDTEAPLSEAASHHGDLRNEQGYTVAMVVEESRLLQVSIFSMLHKKQEHLEFRTVLPAVVTIADEVDAQLKQQMLRFMAAGTLKAANVA